jgi:hypothetical protein
MICPAMSGLLPKSERITPKKTRFQKDAGLCMSCCFSFGVPTLAAQAIVVARPGLSARFGRSFSG